MLLQSPSALAVNNGKLHFDNYTQEDGLFNSPVHCAFQDYRGWMWFGTNQGLSRFDGYRFVSFKNQPDNENSLIGALVRVIFEDSKKNLWVGTENGGLNLFNRNQETFVRVGEKNQILKGHSVNTITEDKKGHLWIGTENGLYEYNVENNKVENIYTKTDNAGALSDNYIRAVRIDHEGRVWVGTNSGLDCLLPSEEKIIHIDLPFKNGKDEIHKIFIDKDNSIWVGSYTSGLFIVDPKTFNCHHVDLDAGNERSVTVRAIERDNDGSYWIGTRGGLYHYWKSANRWECNEHDERNETSLCHNSVLDIFKDQKGDLWIASRGGISYLNQEDQAFRNYTAMRNDNQYLNDYELYAFWIDPQKNIWVGTERGGINVLDRKTQTFRYITRSNGLSSNCIKSLFGESNGDLWIGTYMGGINVYNINSQRVVAVYKSDNKPGSLIDNRVWSFFRDSHQNMWIGTSKGLEKFNSQTRSFEHFSRISGQQAVFWIAEDAAKNLWIGGESELVVFSPSTGKSESFKERTRFFCQDSKGRIWLTSLDKGLGQYNPSNHSFTFYDERNGLSNIQSLCILEDPTGALWISTGNGLSKFDPETKTFIRYDKQNGLHNNQFNYGAAYKAASGEMLFGGIGGFSIFDPLKVSQNKYIPPIVFTGLRIFNKPVAISSEKNAILPKSVSELSIIKLPYDQNNFTLDFAALNFTQSDKNEYSYYLEGFDNQWTDAGTQHSVTYTNLDPGIYTFKLKASNNDLLWNDKGISIQIRILPPYWKTWWFKTFIVLLILGIIYMLVVSLTFRTKLRHEVTYERMKAKKMHELDEMKLRFFTNISHEIRTPLTLISGPLDRLLNSEVSPKESRSLLEVMQRNSQQLLRLINQLLDFRKLEAGSLRMEPRQGEMVQFVRNIIESFSSMAVEKEITLRFHSTEKEIVAFFDPDKIEKVINNLLSNAMKFTDKNGSITTSVTLIRENIYGLKPDEPIGKQYIEISVKDTGVGIAEKNLNKIFSRFFQGPDAQFQTGTGIGLALTKELVTMHNGEISVNSKAGKGSTFTVRLPLNTEYIPDDLTTENDYIDNQTPAPLSDSSENQPNTDTIPSKNVMLIIEDNPDVRFFIRSHFETDFTIYEAADGKEGLSIAIRQVPDIIISDVLMPIMNGKDLCRKLKKDERTSHIPIVLLTALSSKSHELEGLVAGADDYIYKPFDINILQTKIQNLLSIRKALKEKYTSEMVLMPRNITIASPEERFLQKTIEVIEKNIADPDLDIEKLSLEIGVSRMQLYRKLSALTDMTVKEFVRNIRLKRASQLLAQKKMNISEVAYAVGFRDLAHFRKCFRQQYGMNASEYVESQG
jgi:signal transduction histidine kinase/ligand-binding sensor domain-containing protein/DNA-binding response OmpR family regulator